MVWFAFSIELIAVYVMPVVVEIQSRVNSDSFLLFRSRHESTRVLFLIESLPTQKIIK